MPSFHLWVSVLLFPLFVLCPLETWPLNQKIALKLSIRFELINWCSWGSNVGSQTFRFCSKREQAASRAWKLPAQPFPKGLIPKVLFQNLFSSLGNHTVPLYFAYNSSKLNKDIICICCPYTELVMCHYHAICVSSKESLHHWALPHWHSQREDFFPCQILTK